ncbi:50S ribosomal protein L31 [Candidatus Sumerlaeota bacterium]|nr:50S ribosomal protein L31 [Candidatus Sumerlaeota bacterium]
MKEGIHPPMGVVQFRCASCSTRWATTSTKTDARIEEFQGAQMPTIVLETCSSCHPYFTEKQTFIDTAGRVEKFQKRFAKFSTKQDQNEKA